MVTRNCRDPATQVPAVHKVQSPGGYHRRLPGVTLKTARTGCPRCRPCRTLIEQTRKDFKQALTLTIRCGSPSYASEVLSIPFPTVNLDARTSPRRAHAAAEGNAGLTAVNAAVLSAVLAVSGQ